MSRSQGGEDSIAAPARDVPDTFADVEDLVTDCGYRPDTPIEVGVQRFVDWYRDYYRV